MDWEQLAQPGLVHIFERIICHAADQDAEWKTTYHYDDDGRSLQKFVQPNEKNGWLVCIRKYGKVCQTWRYAIQNCNELTSFVKTPALSESTIAPNFKQGRQLIEDGYMRAARGLYLQYVTGDQLESVYENASENKIKMVTIGPQLPRYIQSTTRLVNIVSLCHRATHFYFEFDGKWLNNADAIWRVISAAGHCNGKSKNIDVSITHFDFWDIDWSFTDNVLGDAAGQISKLYLDIPAKQKHQVGDLPTPNWSRLGTIETIEINDWMINHFGEMAIRTATKSVIINMFVNSRNDFDKLNKNWPLLPSSALDIEIRLFCGANKIEKSQVFTKTFDGDASLREEVRQWLHDVEEKKCPAWSSYRGRFSFGF